METTNVMKSILTILISFGLAFSVFGQTRNVVVGTNGAIVQPTNFWSADVTNARSGLGLGSAATNSSSAFQPSSVALSNLASSNGSILTNIQASNIVGVISSSNISSVVFTNISGVLTIDQGGTSATNAYDARQNFGITAIGDALFTASNAATARTAIGGTDVGNSVFTLANPSAITFLRINSDNTVSAIGASDFRTAIGLGSSATNASSAFQPASSMLTNLASSNAFYLSNIQASNITGLLGLTNGGTGADNAINARANLGLGSASTNPASAFQPSSAVLSNLANSNGVNLTNITISNLTGVLTTNGNAVGLTNFPTYLLRTNGDGAGLTNLTAANITGTVALASNVTGTIAISNGGTGATNAATARTNLALGWKALTNTNGAKALYSVLATSLLGYTDEITASSTNATGNNIVTYSNTNTLVVPADLLIAGDSVPAPRSSRHVQIQGTATMRDPFTASTVYGSTYVNVTDESSYTNTIFDFSSGSSVSFGIPISFSTNTVRQQTLTNLGLDWSALTNSNAGTSLVSVNTNGTVVSPTNFWQVAPIQTLVQSIIPVTNSTNAATNARNLYVYSLATNVVGVTNTITLPTNSSTFNGDTATITHEGTTSSVTAIRQLGSATNFTTISNFAESVKFIRESDQWGFYHNISYVEPIRFTDGAIEENKAVSRTNLGLGFSALTNTNAAGFQRAIFSTNSVPTNSANINTINFNTAVAWMEVSVITNGVTNSYRIPLFQ